MKDNKKIKITWDDIDNISDNVNNTPQPSCDRTWGSVSQNFESEINGETGSDSIFLKGWFYLGLSGLLGAFFAWIICEPSYNDYYKSGWLGNMMFPIMTIFMCINFGIIESIIERSWKRTIRRVFSSFGLGLVIGYILAVIAGLLFIFLTVLIFQSGSNGKEIASSPIFWLSRGIAWALFGIAGGLVFGIISKSGKKTSYGMLGGAIGGFIGGFFFDPIALLTNGGEVSRAIGMIILGASTGVAIGLVENALKERWLYVSRGPLAGKQFVLYQNFISIGRSQECLIYLFKDTSILDKHAVIVKKAGRTVIIAFGPVEISGQIYQDQKQKVLSSGDIIRIGRYTFTYAEKEKK